MLLLLNGQIIVQNISSNMHGKEMSSPNTLRQLIFQGTLTLLQFFNTEV